MMRKRVLQRSADSLDRRPLRLVPLAPPDYQVAPSLLQHGCVEKEVLLAGSVGGVPRDIDCSNRALLLAWLDRGFASGQLGGASEREAILALSCHQVKLSGRAPPEEVLLRLPTVALEAAVYLRDDHAHLVLLHHAEGEPADCSRLTVLQVDGRIGAEEVCSLIRQAFQLLYTEATMQFFDRQVAAAADVTSPLPDDESQGPGDRIQEYMQELHSVLSPPGINEFANLLRQWKAGQSPFRRFLQQLLRLFAGVDATHLVVGLRPFVPAGPDQAVFEDFLREHGLGAQPGSVSERPRPFHRAFSHASTLSGNSLRSSANTAISAGEVERRLDAAMDEVRALDAIMQGQVGLDAVAKRLAAGETPHCLSAALMPSRAPR